MHTDGQLPDGSVEVAVLIRPERITLSPFALSVEGVTGKINEVRLTATGPVMAWPEGSF